MRRANRLATEASIPNASEGLKGFGKGGAKEDGKGGSGKVGGKEGAKGGLNPGGFPVSYKSATRRVTAIIVAAPVALCMSWFLYERCEYPFPFSWVWGEC